MDKDNTTQSIVVYCASSSILAPVYTEAARELGAEIARRGASLITGAGHMGLMGAVADACLEGGGHAIGIIPRFMVERGWHHTGMSELRVVETMHERKSLMASMASAAIALPGGIGTFDELCEMLTWRQLGLFKGNVVILNVNNYYDPFLAMLRRATDEHFMRPVHMELFSVATTAEEAVRMAMAPADGREFPTKF